MDAPCTTFAPGFDDLFGGIAKPYKITRPAPPQDEVFRDIFRFLRANPRSMSHEIAAAIGITRDRAYIKLKSLYRMKHLDYSLEPLSDTDPRRYKKWFVVEEDMRWTGGKP
jgi:hypothetical protein